MIIHSSQPIFRVLHLILYGYYIILLNNWYVVTFCIEIFVILHGKNKQNNNKWKLANLNENNTYFYKNSRNWPKKLTRRSFLNSFSNNRLCSFAINSALQNILLNISHEQNLATPISPQQISHHIPSPSPYIKKMLCIIIVIVYKT